MFCQFLCFLLCSCLWLTIASQCTILSHWQVLSQYPISEAPVMTSVVPPSSPARDSFSAAGGNHSSMPDLSVLSSSPSRLRNERMHHGIGLNAAALPAVTSPISPSHALPYSSALLIKSRSEWQWLLGSPWKRWYAEVYSVQCHRHLCRVRHSVAIHSQLLLFCDQSMREKAWCSRKRGA